MVDDLCILYKGIVGLEEVNFLLRMRRDFMVVISCWDEIKMGKNGGRMRKREKRQCVCMF